MWFNWRFVILIIIFIQINFLKSQTNVVSTSDTSSIEPKIIKNKSARKASIYSAVLPGLGQAYNKKYWKIPIIYAGIGGFAYMFYSNHINYMYYRKNLLAVTDDDPNTTNEISGYDQTGLQAEKLRYKKLRDVGIIGFSLVYIFNIVDANVDAHLKTFDVNDNLSFKIKPVFSSTSNNSFGLGLGIKINLKY